MKTTTAGGSISLTSAGSVTTTGITSLGYVDIDANHSGTSGNANITGAVSATNGYVQIRAGGLIKVTSTVKTTTAGNILLFAQTTLQTGAITAAPGGGVDLKANLGGGTSTFYIDGTGQTNGVNGTITAKGQGNVENQASSIVYITNGTAGSAANITVSAPNAINVAPNDSSSRAGYIVLNAQNGVLTMSSALSASGTGANQGAGTIALFANEIDFPATATVSVSQPLTASGTRHGIEIDAQTVKYGALTLHADGNGYSSVNYDVAYENLYTEGSTTVSDNEDPTNILIQLTTGNVQGPVSYIGTGALLATANGAHSVAAAAGYPLSFSGGDVTIQAQGASDSTVTVENETPYSGKALTFSSGNVLLDASGGSTSGFNGGTVNFYADQASISSTTFTMNASGPTTGNGNAGNVNFYATSLSFGGSTKGSLTANGSGTGNGGDVQFQPGIVTAGVKLGTSAGDIQILANGGATSGNAGTVNVNPSSGNITIDTANAVSASVPGSSGQGGNVTLIANPDISVTSGLTGASINVDGKGSLPGGNIKILANGTLNVGTSAGALSLSAQNNGGTGNGGTIELGYLSALNLGGITTVSAGNGSGSNGNGGSLNFHDLGQTTLTSATLSANAAGTGTAGTINIKQTSYSPMNVTGSTLSALGQGVLGATNIQLHTPSDLTIDSSSSLTSNSTGSLGGTILVSFGEGLANANLTLNAAVSANAATSQGGTISVTSPMGGNITSNGSYTAQASSSGTGGNINFNTGVSTQSNTITLPSGSINANGGTNFGNVTLQAGSTISVNVSQLVGKVSSNGADTSITNSQSSGTLVLQKVIANTGNLVVTANQQPIVVFSSSLSAAAVRAVAGNVTMTGNGISVSIGSPAGDDYVQGNNITLATPASSNSNITLGANLDSDGAVMLTVNGNGSIVASGGKIQSVTSGASNSLTATAANGSIGSSSTMLQTGVRNLTLTTSSGASNAAYVNNDTGNTSAVLSILSVNTGGDVQILTTGSASCGPVMAGKNITISGNGVVVNSSTSGIQGEGVTLETPTTSNGDIELVGNVSASLINAIVLEANGTGSVYSDGGIAGGSIAGTASLQVSVSKGHIGSTGNPLLTAVGSLNAAVTGTASLGDIVIDNNSGSNTLVVNSVSAVPT